MNRRVYWIVNGITLYRIVAAVAMVLMIVWSRWGVFKWLLPVSFLTDALDGYLARRYRVVSVAGSALDSIGDDLTVLVALIGLFIYVPGFFRKEIIPVMILGALYLTQTVAALVRYRKLSSFHTYLAKIAAISQGVFLILTFFLPSVPTVLFWVAVILTGLDLAEEIIMVFLLPAWQPDVKGLFTILNGGHDKT
ncbi:MAG TPA: CDP-alcohol phosphatidyltransferase family protein [Puia sp.]|nr:CDP-alcohol phosphatidyltransferase family protein [Puia sp.]